MTLKQFLERISIYTKYFDEEELEFYEKLLDSLKEKNFTENGLKILKAMKENIEKYSNTFSAKELGELLFMPPRSISGSIKKLKIDGYVEKKGLNPVTYGLTNEGISIKLD